MRSTNPRFRRFTILLLILAELMVAINLFYVIRNYNSAPSEKAPVVHEESALQNALMVARLQTAIALTHNDSEPAGTVLTGTIPLPPTLAPVPTATPLSAPVETATRIATSTALPTLALPTPTATATTLPPTATYNATPAPPTPLVITNTPMPQNAATWDAMVQQLTRDARTTGTATPLGPVVTATATEQAVVTSTATATIIAAIETESVAPTATAQPTHTARPPATFRPTTTATSTSVPSHTATVRPVATSMLPPTATPSATLLPPTAMLYYVTPTPSAPDLFGAATLVAQLTANATTTGTATPLPANWRVYTIRILPYEPTPANEATVAMLAIEATARAVTTGEPPASLLFWTATPRPTSTLGPTHTPTPPPLPSPTPTETLTPFVVTATFTPENVMAAATLVAGQTEQAKRIGTSTPLPANAIFATATPRPIVVTSTPTAANLATAEAMAAEETAIAFTTGTPDRSRYITATPTLFREPAARPTNTPTPLLVALDDLTATPTPAATESFPSTLIGKILFLGDFDGRGAPEVYAMDADGTNVMRLSGREFYLRAVDRDSYSADRRFRAFVKREEAGTQERQIHAFDTHYNSERQLTNMKDGSTSWDPVWSPIDEVIAFVSNQTDSDEIWLVERESRAITQLTFNDGPWDKHPSWSPDGRQIVFVSSRGGRREIWIMDRDGRNQQRLVALDFEAWDPVWVKYADQ